MLTPIDGHVHFHPRFDLRKVFDAAARNFAVGQRAAATRESGGTPDPDRGVDGVLLLAERRGEGALERLRRALALGGVCGDWRLETGAEPEVVLARRGADGSEGDRIAVIAGRQAVTRENLEVLALCREVDVADGTPVRTALRRVRELGAVPVLPWGFGKWTGDRGRVVTAEVEHADGVVFLGDNGGRPAAWSDPEAFAQGAESGVALLPGSDPLDLADEWNRIGGYGFLFPVDPGSPTLAADLRLGLLGGTEWPIPFGSRVGTARFLWNQFALRAFRRTGGDS